jgi:hypothetical protein
VGVFQESNKGRCYGDISLATFGLGIFGNHPVFGYTLLDLNHIFFDMYNMVFKVNMFPFKSKQFTGCILKKWTANWK